MNKQMIRYILGQVLRIEGILMLLPCVVAVIYREKEGYVILGVAALCFFLGTAATIRKPESQVFYLKEGCVATALSWIVMSVFGCLPFYLTGAIPSFVDAMFETISGFTTTGSSILTDVEALAMSLNFWRCFTHWIGGMGVLVFLLAVIPLSGGSHINLMRAESPGPSVGKLVPKIRYTARILYIIYVGMTLVQIVLLLIGHMPLYDALTITFSTAGTGGFAIKSDSISSYSPYLQWVITIFMILFGVNFNAYYLILFRKFKKAAAIEEVRYYFLVILAATAFIAWSLCRSAMGFADALRHAAFQVGSIITTTGFATTDFNLWSGSCKTVLVLLMFIGACAGSTGGGIKVSRFVLLIKTVKKELNSYIHPKSIKKIKVDGKPVEHEVVRSTNVYFITFMILFVLSVFLVSLEGKDLVTTFTAVATTINNVGPGLEQVGPMANFAHLTNLSKIVLSFDMLAGRLELFPLLILFHPSLWKDAVNQGVRRRKKEKNVQPV
ncbi:MAG TPA: TrkH family potassium uptake protein [Candidatus Anaerobutyricum stercoripullorum]|uniref:TrkH family potassium uptake protein n=1 Tax=Candidatus Anaerobutyricum stercoripullorum TaxID=2838456 RepID=A0A9D1X612_9FIRM|nr:TrkH family potassium uptake protein [Candidatus Anaerobutyricum stercoripullorum]